MRILLHASSSLFVLLAGCTATSQEAPPDPTTAAALRADVDFLTTLDPPRSFGNPAALDRAADHIAADLLAAGGRVERQQFEVDGDVYQNVVARFGPDDGALLVVGAHYDSYGDLPGADDNASGTAVMLALAHAIGDVELTRPVEFVAYTLEEPPQFSSDDMGSARHARRLAEAGTEVYGMLCLEMLGFFDESPDSQEYPVEQMELLYGDRADFLAVVGRAEDVALVDAVHAAMQGDDLRVVKLAAPGPVEGIDLSDHRNSWAEGFTAVMLTDTSFFRNPHYHRATDTADRLDYARMETAVDRLRDVVAALAGDDGAADGE